MSAKNFILLFFILFTAFTASAQEDGDKTPNLSIVKDPSKAVHIPFIEKTSAPVIDGVLSDEIWKNAARFADFVQIQPGDGTAPSKPTEVYMVYDELNLYIAFRCYDERDKIRATVAKRDDIFNEDNVRVYLDTFNDQRRAYIIGFNPLGIQQDGLRGADGNTDFSFDLVMESKGAIVEDGWTVEARIPFKSLRYKDGKNSVWGLHIYRNIDRFNDELDSWMPVPQGNNNFLALAGKINGLENIKTLKTLELVPSITVSQSADRVEDAANPAATNFEQGKFKQDSGLTLKYTITPNVTLDAAFNPDFAEVEADAPIVTANERFPLFFPERRPFFLEGIDIFNSNSQVVNTRNIADPDVALKLTGKVGKTTFGALSAIDRFSGLKSKAYANILRLRRDVGKQSNVGFFLTNYNFGARRHNTLAGFDGSLRLNSKKQISFEVFGTTSRRSFYDPDTNRSEYRTGNGISYRAVYDFTSKLYGYYFGTFGRSRDYRADLGFTRRTNSHGVFGGWRISSEPRPQAKIVRLNFNQDSSVYFDESRHLQNLKVSAGLSGTLQGNAGFYIGASYGREHLYEYEFGARRNTRQQGAFFGDSSRSADRFGMDLNYDKTFSKRFSIGGGFGMNSNVFDYDFGNDKFGRTSGAYRNYQFALGEYENCRLLPNCVLTAPHVPPIDPGKGFLYAAGFGASLKPVDQWRISLEFDKRNLRRNDNGQTVLDSELISLRSTYQFTRFTFIRTRFDYDSLQSGIFGQAVFGWNPRPGTAFYVGYNNNSSYRAFLPNGQRFEDGLRLDGQRFFIRISYLFRKSF